MHRLSVARLSFGVGAPAGRADRPDVGGFFDTWRCCAEFLTPCGRTDVGGHHVQDPSTELFSRPSASRLCVRNFDVLVSS
mmetsp:Transcript_59516/g.96283  ORF Transcript_59516/g.96283 Transcript_59516/m.96283 type:complete len:80 (+) Transcript_59516:660-899(+)